MSQMIMIKPDEAKILQLKLLGNDNVKIAQITGFSEDYIKEILLKKHIADAIKDIEIEDVLRDNKLAKVKGAKSILDSVIKGAQMIADQVDARKWNKNHVELFKLLINDLAKEEKNIINNIQNQINIVNNNNSQQSNGIMDDLDEIINGFPSDYQSKFWTKVIIIANELKNELAAKGTRLIVK